MSDPTLRQVDLVDLGEQRRRLGPRLDAAIAAVVDHGQFILGPEVVRLEEELARRGGVRHAIGCSSGTDALLLCLLAWEVGPGDAVFVPAFTFAATAEVVVRTGAVPVFVDVLHDTFNVDVASVVSAVEGARAAGLRPAGVIAVDLFGQPADYDAIARWRPTRACGCSRTGAQSFGAELGGRPVGSLAAATAASFFPSKPLGCYGDGGAVLTDDDVTARRIRSLRSHGRGEDKNDNTLIGINSRLDTLQAAILLAKLEIFADELALRRQVAARYTDGLADVVRVPCVVPGTAPAWACYTVAAADREQIRHHLRRQGVASAVYYETPLHRRSAYRRFPSAPDGLAVAERLSGEVVSLPMHPYIDPDNQDRVIDAVRTAAG